MGNAPGLEHKFKLFTQTRSNAYQNADFLAISKIPMTLHTPQCDGDEAARLYAAFGHAVGPRALEPQ